MLLFPFLDFGLPELVLLALVLMCVLGGPILLVVLLARRKDSAGAGPRVPADATVEARLARINDLLNRKLISPDDYHWQKDKILSEL